MLIFQFHYQKYFVDEIISITALKMMLLLLFWVASVWCDLEEIDIEAVGRPFALGVLYDRHRDYIIDGPKIWTHEELR